MKRRRFIGQAAAGALLGASAVGCSESQKEAPTNNSNGKKYRWKMVTSWPKNLPGLGLGAEYLAETIGKLSGGQLTVKVYGAGELVPAFEVFDAVRGGVSEMGHSASYYWQGKDLAFNFFTTIPFGMTVTEANAWLYQGGGLELWEELYRPFGLIPMPAGNTGIQMAGWFNREIKSVEDFKGLKMRIPGLGGKVIERVGGVPVNLSGGELFIAMQTGTIDATEWATPYNDLALGLHKVAKYYYYPGWQEPGPVLECIVNKEAFETLPPSLQETVRAACYATNAKMAADYLANNYDALQVLVKKNDVKLLPLPADVIETLRTVSNDIVRESVDGNPFGQKCHAAYREFQEKVSSWHKVSESYYFALR